MLYLPCFAFKCLNLENFIIDCRHQSRTYINIYNDIKHSESTKFRSLLQITELYHRSPFTFFSCSAHCLLWNIYCVDLSTEIMRLRVSSAFKKWMFRVSLKRHENKYWFCCLNVLKMLKCLKSIEELRIWSHVHEKMIQAKPLSKLVFLFIFRRRALI